MEPVKGRVYLPPIAMKRKWALPLFSFSLLVVFFLTSLNMGLLGSVPAINSVLSLFLDRTSGERRPSPNFVEAKLSAPPPVSSPPVPRLAYLVSGSKGDLDRLWRTLHALYHPRNLYVVHLDLESPAAERNELAVRLANHTLFAKVGNIHMIQKANMVTYRGPTMVSNTLHACAILLKKTKEWDWFINLSASDYPLVTQDDLLFSFSKLPRNLNFVEHTSRLGWKEGKRAKPLMVDPGLYLMNKSDVFFVSPKRQLPTAFKLFTGGGNPLKRRVGVDGPDEGVRGVLHLGLGQPPRILLMYYTNFVSSPEGYFQTVICNSPEFNGTVVNYDLHYISWDVPPRQHPHTLSVNDTRKMIQSNAPFARKFRRTTRCSTRSTRSSSAGEDGVTPGGWCAGKPRCSLVGDETRLRPGPGSRRLQRLMDRVVQSPAFEANQCR
ncbi:hypothetical protein HPP92_021773 [Vanilla planifolia]|uniref:Uncharacterized protein n=1 Tax=Vanilla planifolia TaxID=51239 RepID=A0A835PZR9_VANPL|nr:hypothetical protein HPP92_021773 [Vanilla planifolia]